MYGLKKICECPVVSIGLFFSQRVELTGKDWTCYTDDVHPKLDLEEMKMAIDIKEKIEDLVEKLKKNPALLKKFNTEPVKVVEELVGIDLPDELIEKVVDGIKAKLTMDKMGDALGALGGLFGKK